MQKQMSNVSIRSLQIRHDKAIRCFTTHAVQRAKQRSDLTLYRIYKDITQNMRHLYYHGDKLIVLGEDPYVMGFNGQVVSVLPYAPQNLEIKASREKTKEMRKLITNLFKGK